MLIHFAQVLSLEDQTRPKACRKDPLVESLPASSGHRPAESTDPMWPISNLPWLPPSPESVWDSFEIFEGYLYIHECASLFIACPCFARGAFGRSNTSHTHNIFHCLPHQKLSSVPHQLFPPIPTTMSPVTAAEVSFDLPRLDDDAQHMWPCNSYL